MKKLLLIFLSSCALMSHAQIAVQSTAPGSIVITPNGLQGKSNPLTDTTNVALGASALKSTTTGLGNTAIGLETLFKNTTGNYNTASGTNTLYSNTAGFSNTANGYGALYKNTTG